MWMAVVVVADCAQCGARTENEEPTDHLNISSFKLNIDCYL